MLMLFSKVVLRLFLVISLFTCSHAFGASPVGSHAVRIDVNVSEMSLTVWSGNKVLRYYRNIAIGSGGISDVHYMGDESTPVGEYRVLWINRDSVFGNFVGLDYPTMRHVELAAKAGRLSAQEYRRLMYAVQNGQAPPFNTPLGGRIGIHGIGRGSLQVHETVNWTNGCIALTNREMHELMQWTHVGTRVSIHR